MNKKSKNPSSRMKKREWKMFGVMKDNDLYSVYKTEVSAICYVATYEGEQCKLRTTRVIVTECENENGIA